MLLRDPSQRRVPAFPDRYLADQLDEPLVSVFLIGGSNLLFARAVSADEILHLLHEPRVQRRQQAAVLDIPRDVFVEETFRRLAPGGHR